jgi:protein SCO1/2
MTAKSSVNRNIVLLVIAAVALASGLLVAMALKPSAVALQSGTLLPQPRVLPELGLSDSHGQPYPLARFQGHWTVLFPGFTSCPDICPTTLALLKQVRAQLGAKAPALTVVMLTIDPERDTPETLTHYVEYFDPAFVGLRSPEPNLQRVAQSLGVVYTKVPDAQSGSYTMDHSAAMILINPQGQLAGYITPPYQLAALVSDFRSLLGG